jgi:hypothetical protein
MHHRAAVLAILSLLATAAFAAPPRTLRVDYYHTGDASREVYSLDRVVLEPLPWPGNPARPLDDTNLGEYFFEVRDLATNRVIFSRGFDSIYGEWATTGEAKLASRTFHESLRFPSPPGPVQVVLKKRDADNVFREAWAVLVDPGAPTVDPSVPPAPARVIEIQRAGDSSTKVDLLFLGDGYPADQLAKCEADIRRLVDGVFSFSPFRERRQDFNLWAICAPTPEAGVSHPASGIHRQTRFGSAFDAFGTPRYALSFDNRAIRTTASLAPYDVLAIVMNERAYGNGGIFGQFASVSIDNPNAIPAFVHEFGHHFAGLADEYYFNAGVAYAPRTRRVEPWEPNVTALLDPASLKWKALLTPGVPLPTPWPKAEYERVLTETPDRIRRLRAAGRPPEAIASAQQDARAATERALSEGPFAGRVGAFEGAMYEEQGYYRPEQRCVMISGTSFCAVCRAAIDRIIDLYATR